MPDWSGAARVLSGRGGYRRLEDYCNSAPGGNAHHYTASAVTADEEILTSEIGDRVVNAIVEKAVDGWDALLNAAYAEMVARETA